MVSYLEIKQLLQDLYAQRRDADATVDETSDISITADNNDGETSIFLSNEQLREAYNSIQNYCCERLEMYNSQSFEVVLQNSGLPRIIRELGPIVDEVNGITYSIKRASLNYSMFLLSKIAECVKENGRAVYYELRHRVLHMQRYGTADREDTDLAAILSDLLRAYCLRIETTRPRTKVQLRKIASSFEFHYMYKRGIPMSEYTDIWDIYSMGRPGVRFVRTEVDTPPHRFYNDDVLDYYTMALESRDPFTAYISFYHVVEHYFDAVYRKKLTEEIKNKLTRPDFSYKNEEKIYELAKFIRKHMSSDDKSGKGDEFESLKYVLMAYVPIEELKKRISELDTQAISYYQNSFVPFTTSKKTKIAWADSQAVFINLATRIYETRNALVHSKSEQVDNQYRPYENKKDLTAEIALIKSVAELVIINSSEMM